LKCNSLLFLLLAAAAYPQLKSTVGKPALDLKGVHAFVAPGPNDVRSSCPMLSTFANHGFINRNGRGITRQQISSAFNDVINFDDSMARFFLNGVFPRFNSTPETFDLDRVNKHNDAVEHDASLVRDDLFFLGLDVKDTVSKFPPTNQSLVKQMIQTSSNGKVFTFKDLVKFRKIRQQDSIKRNPDFNSTNFALTQGFVASGEGTVFLKAFGQGKLQVPLADVESFMGQNKLPDNYVSPQEATSVLNSVSTIANLFIQTYPYSLLTPNWLNALRNFYGS
jgi:hypothetical protein